MRDETGALHDLGETHRLVDTGDCKRQVLHHAVHATLVAYLCVRFAGQFPRHADSPPTLVALTGLDHVLHGRARVDLHRKEVVEPVDLGRLFAKLLGKGVREVVSRIGGAAQFRSHEEGSQYKVSGPFNTKAQIAHSAPMQGTKRLGGRWLGDGVDLPVDLQQQYTLPLLCELDSDAACVGGLAYSALAAHKDPLEALLLYDRLQCRVEGLAFRFGADEFGVGRHRVFCWAGLVEVSRAAAVRSSRSSSAGETTAGASGGREQRVGRRENLKLGDKRWTQPDTSANRS